MKRLAIVVVSVGLFMSGAYHAEAHAFLDHAEPRVGSTITASPSIVKIWFTDGLREKVSWVEVFDFRGQEVDKQDVKIDSEDRSMAVSVPKLPAGTYKVMWNAVCPLGHLTSGDFTFEVK